MNTFNHLNGLTLAYVGDAIYEIYIRTHLVTSGIVKPNELHKHATQYVSAKAQAMLMKALLLDESLLTEKEKDIFKRGRNAKSSTSAKNTDVVTYRIATGFEAVFGYLHLNNEQERLEQLVTWCIAYVQKCIGEKNDKKVSSSIKTS